MDEQAATDRDSPAWLAELVHLAFNRLDSSVLRIPPTTKMSSPG